MLYCPFSEGTPSTANRTYLQVRYSATAVIRYGGPAGGRGREAVLLLLPKPSAEEPNSEPNPDRCQRMHAGNSKPANRGVYTAHV